MDTPALLGVVQPDGTVRMLRTSKETVERLYLAKRDTRERADTLLDELAPNRSSVYKNIISALLESAWNHICFVYLFEGETWIYYEEADYPGTPLFEGEKHA